jgi:hypothetical protein
MFGTVPAVREATATDWADDPYSLGSYSYIPVGVSCRGGDGLGSDPDGEA